MRALIAIVATALAATAATSSNAQIIDGRNFSIDGFAAYAGEPGSKYFHAGGTTGGEGGKVVKAETFSELQAYLQATAPYIILVDNDITTGITAYVDDLSTGKLMDKQDGSQGVPTTYGERILVASNKTLIGIADPTTGQAPLISRITFVFQCVNNVIFRNLRFTMNGAPILKSGENKIVAMRDGQQVEVGDPDCIGIQADKESLSKNDRWGAHFWFDHCEFFNGNAANKDRYDGLLDCKNDIQWMTISYCHFHNHDKSNLFGKGDSDEYDRTITLHHCFYENIDGSRLPLQRWGHLHYYNNYMKGCQDGFNPRKGSVCYVEACYFEDTKAPITYKGEEEGVNISTAEGYGIVYKSCKNLLPNYTNIDNAKYESLDDYNKGSWTPTQTQSDYKVNHLDKTMDVPEICSTLAGAGKISVWTEYASEIPAESKEEFNAAIADASTGKTYDKNGKTMTSASADGMTEEGWSKTPGTSAIGNAAAAEESRTEYYDLGGRKLSSPRGICIGVTTNSRGTKSVKKAFVR